MHFRWRPDLSMFQYQDLMIALPTPLEGLFNLEQHDRLPDRKPSLRRQPAQPSKQQILMLHTCRILLGLCLTSPIYSRGAHFHVSGSLKERTICSYIFLSMYSSVFGRNSFCYLRILRMIFRFLYCKIERETIKIWSLDEQRGHLVKLVLVRVVDTNRLYIMVLVLCLYQRP